ncbi:major facilitator superfamily domain-containing protein, partial [Suillus subalutaceus]|uniref:major facilitator superfamily domain-containing protein n=1 Tax=Suillus subalutaceus TaxID=48586 RepID=UPI001B85FF7B
MSDDRPLLDAGNSNPHYGTSNIDSPPLSYKRNELGLRTALFYCGNSISYTFSTLAASGILAGLDGTLGVPARRWLFFVEGTLTIVVAVSAIWILPDFPSTPSVWLTPDEQSLAKRRMEKETAAGDRYQAPVERFSGLVDALVDRRVWWLGATLSFMVASCHAVISFQHYPLQWVTSRLSASYSVHLRGFWELQPHLLWPGTPMQLVTASGTSPALYLSVPLGLSLLFSTMNTAIRYLSPFFMTQAPVAFVIFVTWVLNTFSQSQSKRAAAIALINSMGICGNIGAPYFWPSSWGPSYVKSYLICILTSVICIAMCRAFRRHLARCNK